ncbi:MAG: GAF domain-containing protein [Candidatus Dormibacteraeota bacterium]|nr:GAF domain-containing protein [Candidatus Dormibacteraeota bacterium]MBV9526380.1 GAF domain-containing protein [Candidatus Dormibacteraeota bacterium]
MVKPPIPDDEAQRQAAVDRLHGVAPGTHAAWQDIVHLASLICETPTALVTVIDGQRQWFISSVGAPPDEGTRDAAFCAHAILEPDMPMVVPDAREDPVLSDYHSVVAEGVRFYAGVPINLDTQPLGTLCVIDERPRDLSDEQLASLQLLARIAERQLACELRKRN